MSKVFKNKIIYILIFISMMFTLVNGERAVEANSIEWLEYTDFIDQESDIAWEHPELYVGCNASFDRITYPTFLIGSLVDGKIEQYGNASLEEGVDYIVNIVDYFYEESTNTLWYKIEASEGYTLPQAFMDHPYIRYAWSYSVEGSPPAVSLQMLPKKAMVRDETLIINKNMTMASAYREVEKDKVPELFDVTYVYSNEASYEWYGYDLGDISSWGLDIESEYHYVNQDEVTLIPVAVYASYEKLLNTESTREYNYILENIPQDILDMFLPSFNEAIENQYQELVRIENIEYSTTVDINGTLVPVSVKGKIPEEGVVLSVSTVDFETVVSEGFKVKEATDLITSLDIKIINKDDGSEWQPEEGQIIDVSIGLSALGYEDGRIFQLEHKHEDIIDFYEIFIVVDGKLTIGIDGFSIFTVYEPLGRQNAKRIGNNGANLSMTVGETAVYYFTTNNTGNDVDKDAPGRPSKWAVEDTTGAIYYTVHASDGPRNGGVTAPWIKVVALRETTTETRVKLTSQRETNNNNNPSVSYLTITSPKAEAGNNNGKKLYLKDTVNTTGTITATLVDTNGNEIANGLDGAAFTWERDDDLFITPRAYSNNYRSVNIAVDHAGLVEDRKLKDNSGNYDFVTYTVKATLSDGNELEAQYTVYYQSEFLNAGFENVKGTSKNYSFFVNGTPNLFWKTTAPGSGGNLTKDIEVANFQGGTCNQTFGVTGAADGIQFAELNAEAFGALYQDIITAPDEDIDWKFAHAPRKASWSSDIHNAMFIVIGATEDAQKLTTQAQLEALGRQAKNEAASSGNTGFLTCQSKEDIEFIYNGTNFGKYSVWYHDSGRSDNNKTKFVWTDLEGAYRVPENQYRTRLFFVSEANASGQNQNGGNLIDIASGGQYKEVLIEYYEESYDASGNLVVEHLNHYDQIETALVYSYVDVLHLKQLEQSDRHDYLHRILINGSNYPYDVRYEGTDNNLPTIYIEKYRENPNSPLMDPDSTKGEDYDDYDIVVQIFVRDTVVAIEKKLEFPVEKDANGNITKEYMTVEQKLNLIQSLPNGYQATFTVYSDTPNVYEPESETITIINPDPIGNYGAHTAPDNNPILGYKYRVKETNITELKGLKLGSVTIEVRGYRYGAVAGSNEFDQVWYETINIPNPNDANLVSPEININAITQGENAGYKIADVIVTNSYVEKETVIEYKAVGNGKVAFIGVGGSDLDFVDTPTETLAYYSGKAKGAAVHPGNGATFVGWFKDERCREEDRVTAADGVWSENGDFKPNANILNAEKVTFYAKFVSGAITINRTNAKPNQVFVYHVTGTDGLDIYVSLECDENGNGSKTIYEIIDSDYTVTEVTDFSWRYPDAINSDNEKIETSITKTSPDSEPGKPIEFIFNFDGQREHPYWVNGYSKIMKNIYKVISGGS